MSGAKEPGCEGASPDGGDGAFILGNLSVGGRPYSYFALASAIAGFIDPWTFTLSGAMVSLPVRELIWAARCDETASRRTTISAHEQPSWRIFARDSFSMTGVMSQICMLRLLVQITPPSAARTGAWPGW